MIIDKSNEYLGDDNKDVRICKQAVRKMSGLQSHLRELGIREPREVVLNPSYDEMFEHETDPSLEGLSKGQLTECGAMSVRSGEFTGRTPRDRYVVKDSQTQDKVWWKEPDRNDGNQAIDQRQWDALKSVAVRGASKDRLYVIDGYCGSSPASRLRVRFILSVAWQAHFVKNMFLRPSPEELVDFEPDFTVINSSASADKDWRKHGLNSEAFVAINLSERMMVIGGTWYAGEMKKGIFSVMNYLLPSQGMAAMHCSANIGADGTTSIMFGLSGTGKTTLSSDSGRALIGDDEHGWDDAGVFNLEGGCYAKTIDLDPRMEPEIYTAIRRNALLENVAVDAKGRIDFADTSITENGRASYPIDHLDNIALPSMGAPATHVIFLAADAYGVLPPVSKLEDDQALYYFMSGFTAKVAGTELGVDKPSATFSPCFGSPFLTLHPEVYAKILLKRMRAAGSHAYLVNTGWDGSGQRMSLAKTRSVIRAIQSGEVDHAPTTTLPMFNLSYPSDLSGLGTSELDPAASHSTASSWKDNAIKLATAFASNFANLDCATDEEDLSFFGPHA